MRNPHTAARVAPDASSTLDLTQRLFDAVRGMHPEHRQNGCRMSWVRKDALRGRFTLAIDDRLGRLFHEALDDDRTPLETILEVPRAIELHARQRRGERVLSFAEAMAVEQASHCAADPIQWDVMRCAAPGQLRELRTRLFHQRDATDAAIVAVDAEYERVALGRVLQ